MIIRWEPASYSKGKAFFVDTDHGRWYIKYDKTLKKWLVNLNGVLRAKADSLQSAQDFVAIELAKVLVK